MLIACVLLNAQYAQVCKMLNAYMLIGRVHARVFIVGMHGLPCVCVCKKSEHGEIGCVKLLDLNYA